MSIPALLTFASCATEQVTTRATLRDIDTSKSQQLAKDVKIGTRSEEEIKQAYYEYLRTAAKEEKARKDALTRLAQMELALSNRLMESSKLNQEGQIEDERYLATLSKTASLLETALREYPDAKDNDVTLYQLAKTYSQLGENEKTLEVLKEIASKHPDSYHYPEAQFRLAEEAFLNGDYFGAEDAYTEVIVSPDGRRFSEKAFFKRGWARYKQELYAESVDDYMEALTLHKFGDYDRLDNNEKELFNEYFRAIGLSFSHLDGANSLQNYFKDNSDFRYLYHTYFVISDIYLKQDRYSDAAETLQQFTSLYPDSEQLPIAQMNIINIWQEGGFAKHVHSEIEKFYAQFSPGAAYWKKGNNANVQAKALAALREYIASEASWFHNQYQKTEKNSDYQQAKLWYERYLKDFAPFANKDKINSLYASLLYENKQYAEALTYFELAAYDGDIILDKNSAYTTITLSNSLYQQAADAQQTLYLEKLVHYTGLFVELYPHEEQSINASINAAQLAFNHKQYDKANALLSQLPNTLDPQRQYTANFIKARALFETANYSEAEAVYTSMLASPGLQNAQRHSLTDNLALSVYRQAEQYRDDKDFAGATRNFVRISKIAPESDIAATALYDAIALAMQYESWQNAIDFIEQFKGLYPQHKLTNDVTKKLSVAYLKSNQGDKAAREFERIANLEENDETRMAALWQAAELYESKGDLEGAIRSYRSYANTYTKPYAQYVESMHKLSELYQKQRDTEKAQFWLLKLANSDQYASEKERSDRTIFLAAQAALTMAEVSQQQFDRSKLNAPLQANLRKKKKLMQETIKLYGKASSFGLSDITTKATYEIGKIYRDFSVALLESERPDNLSSDELVQYEILLEDQAFPFEDKAIEFYETNIKRSRDGINNEWLKKSHSALGELFPVRYARKGKAGGYYEDQQ